MDDAIDESLTATEESLCKRIRELEMDKAELDAQVRVLRGIIVQTMLGKDRGDPGYYSQAIPAFIPNPAPNCNPSFLTTVQTSQTLDKEFEAWLDDPKRAYNRLQKVLKE